MSRSELSCITQLVYYSGIRQKEVVKLRVLDVVDANGEVKAVIRNKLIMNRIYLFCAMIFLMASCNA